MIMLFLFSSFSEGDLEKARSNGKSVLIEGLLIDPALYLEHFVPKIPTSQSGSPSHENAQLLMESSCSSDFLVPSEPIKSRSPPQQLPTSKANFVAVVPFLLTGPLDRRQTTADGRSVKALSVIDRYGYTGAIRQREGCRICENVS